MEEKLSHDHLLSVLDYNPETGVFVWKGSRRLGHNGKVAGTVGGGAYKYAVIGLLGRNYSISRLAWFYVHGAWPENHVRFLNGDASDTRIANLALRVATKRFKNGQPSRNMALPAYKQPVTPARRAGHLMARFGMTLDHYVRLLKNQNGVCAICEQPETRIVGGTLSSLAVDHNHSTGGLRELLCFRCNNGIGHFGDDPEIVDRASAYLRRHASQSPANVVPLKRKS